MSEDIRVKDEREFSFTIIDNHILENEELTAYEKIVYIILCRFANYKERTCYPSFATIQKLAGCSRITVIRSIKKLEEKGYIKKESRVEENNGSKSNLYRIIDIPSIKMIPPEYQNDTPGVSQRYGGGISEIPKQYTSNNNNILNTNVFKSDSKSESPLQTLKNSSPEFYQSLNSREIEVIEIYELLLGIPFQLSEVEKLRAVLKRCYPAQIKKAIQHFAQNNYEAFKDTGFEYCFEPLMKGAFGIRKTKSEERISRKTGESEYDWLIRK